MKKELYVRDITNPDNPKRQYHNKRDGKGRRYSFNGWMSKVFAGEDNNEKLAELSIPSCDHRYSPPDYNPLLTKKFVWNGDKLDRVIHHEISYLDNGRSANELWGLYFEYGNDGKLAAFRAGPLRFTLNGGIPEIDHDYLNRGDWAADLDEETYAADNTERIWEEIESHIVRYGEDRDNPRETLTKEELDGIFMMYSEKNLRAAVTKMAGICYDRWSGGRGQAWLDDPEGWQWRIDRENKLIAMEKAEMEAAAQAAE